MSDGSTADTAASRDPDALDLDALPGFLGYQIRRTQSWVFSEFLTELGDLDLTPGAFGLIALVRANPGITQNQLARAFSIDKSTLTPVLNRLEQRGLIERTPLARDRRFNALRVPPSGTARVAELLARLAAFEARMTARLGKTKAAQLVALLAELRGDDAAGDVRPNIVAGAPR